MEWNGVLLTGRLNEEVQQIIVNSGTSDEVEVIIRNGNCPFTNEFTGGIEHHPPSFMDSTVPQGHLSSQTAVATMNGTYGPESKSSMPEFAQLPVNSYGEQFKPTPHSMMSAPSYGVPIPMSSAGKRRCKAFS
jgi:hypothetical protein